MHSEHLIHYMRNLQGLKKDGEHTGEEKHKACAKPVTSKTATSSPIPTNLTTCTSKLTPSTAVAKPTPSNSQQLSASPLIHKVLQLSQVSQKTARTDPRQYIILIIHSKGSYMYNLHSFQQSKDHVAHVMVAHYPTVEYATTVVI